MDLHFESPVSRTPLRPAADYQQLLTETRPVDQAYGAPSPLDSLWRVTAQVQRWWSGNNQDAISDFATRFNGEGLSPGQRLVQLFDHTHLGWDLKVPVSEGALAFYKGLLEEEGSGDIKGDFQLYFGAIQQIAGIETWTRLIEALHQPSTPENKKILGAFCDVLRIDLAYLQAETESVMSQGGVSFEEKMVHLHLFLSSDSVQQDTAAAVLGKLSTTDKDSLRVDEEWDAVIGKGVQELRDLVGQKKTNLAMCQVMRSFQETSQNQTVLALYEQLPAGLVDSIRQYQTEVLEERDMLNSRITRPGVQVGGNFFGCGTTTYDYISREQHPSGDIAKGAMDKMIAHLAQEAE